MISLKILLALVSAASPDLDLATSQNYVSSVVLDNDGTIWCATSGGIAHYDPSGGWLESLLYPDGINWVGSNDILLDDSLMWVATDGEGLALLQDGSWQTYSSFEGVPGTGYVYSVHAASGLVWAGTDAGLAMGSTDGFVPIDENLTGGAFQAGEVTDIESFGSTMYMATDRGVYSLDLTGSVYSPGSWTSYEDSTLSLGIQGIYIASSDSVFGYGSGGVALKEGNSWKRLLDYSVSSDSVVKGLLMTPDGLLAACRVVTLLDGGDWVHYGSDYPSGSYASFLAEIDGTVWCGFGLSNPSLTDAGRGIGYLEDGAWKRLAIPGIPASSCYQMVRDQDRFYVGSHRLGLMAFYPDSGWNYFATENTPVPRNIRNYTAAVSASPGVWTSSYHWGLTWIDDRGTYSMVDDTVITFVSDSLAGVQSDVIQVVCPLLNNQVVDLDSQQDALWIAQEAFWETPEEPSGIVAVSGDPESADLTWTARTENDGLASKNLLNIFPCGDDSLWVSFASENGCQLLVHGGDPLDKSSDQWYPSPDESYTTSWGLTSNQVFCFARSSSGEIYAGTGNGVCRWTGSSFTEIGGINGAVKAMEIDEEDVLWCVTEEALYSINGSEVNIYNESNSDYIPSVREENEFSYFDPDSQKVYFSSIIGLWSKKSSQQNAESQTAMFYPQPYLPEMGRMHMAWNIESGVTVDFFDLSASYIGSVSADSRSSWSWDGTLNGEELATGIYILIVRTAEETVRNKIALVR